MRIGRSSALILALLAVFVWLPATAFATSIESRTGFYRLLAKYRHGNEIIDFDIVVGCAVRVTRWGDGDKSYDAFRDPAVYVKATNDGGAVMQIVPDACRGETTANGQVPDDFLPGAIWFDDAIDLSFGIAYVTEDAFEGPKSKLKFLGASIAQATREEFMSFEPTAAENLMDPRPLFSFMPAPDIEQIKRHLGNRRTLHKLWPRIYCSAVRRLHLTDPAQRAVVAEYWPSSKPRYWMPTEAQLNEINKRISIYNHVFADGRPALDYSRLNDNRGDGFPTRAHGGVLHSKHRPTDKLPPVVFPLQRDEGVPWLTKDYLEATRLYRNVHVASEQNRGFAYCYAEIWGTDFANPAYKSGTFTTLIDGEPVLGETTDERTPRDRPWPFFERDQYFYLQDTFGLN